MAKTLTTKSTDGVWNLPHITSLLNGSLEPRTKQLIAFPDWLNLSPVSVNMLTASSTDGPAFHIRSHTQNTSSSTTSTPHPDTAPANLSRAHSCPKITHSGLHLEALLQMQKTNPFCKCISRRLLNGKAPHHEFDTFAHVKGLLYKHVTDAGKKFLALWSFLNLGNIQYSWKLTTNWVTKVIHTHIVSLNANTIGRG